MKLNLHIAIFFLQVGTIFDLIKKLCFLVLVFCFLERIDLKNLSFNSHYKVNYVFQNEIACVLAILFG